MAIAVAKASGSIGAAATWAASYASGTNTPSQRTDFGSASGLQALTFSTNHTLVGVVLAVGVGASGFGDGDAIVYLQENVAGTWTTRATATRTNAQIIGSSAINPGVYLVDFVFASSYAVDTTASKWRFKTDYANIISDSWKFLASSSTNWFFAAYSDVTYTPVADDLLMIPNGDYVIDFDTTTRYGSIYLGRSTLNFVDGATRAVNGNIHGFNGHNFLAGTSGTPCTNLTIDLYASGATARVLGTISSIWSNFATSIDNQIGVIKFYGSYPTTERCKIYSGISVGGTTFETIDDVSGWASGDNIAFSRRTHTNYGSSGNDFTQYSLNGTPSYNAGTGRYTVTFTPALLTHDVPANSDTNFKTVAMRQAGYGINITNSGGGTTRLTFGFMPSQFFIRGVQISKMNSTPGSIQSAYTPLSGDVSKVGDFYFGHNSLRTVNASSSFSGLANGASGNDFIIESINCYATALSFTQASVYAGDTKLLISEIYVFAANPTGITLYRGQVVDGLYVSNSGLYITCNGFLTSKKIRAWQNSGFSSNTSGALIFAGSNTYLTDIMADGCPYGIGYTQDSVLLNAENVRLGTVLANVTADIKSSDVRAFDSDALDIYYSTITKPTYANSLPETHQRFKEINGSATAFYSFTKYAEYTAQSSATEMLIHHIDATGTQTAEYGCLSAVVTGLKLAVFVECTISNAAYYAGTHTLPTLTITYDNGAKTDSGAASASTSLQTISAITDALAVDSRPITIAISSKTDAATTTGDIVLGTMTANLRQYGYIFSNFTNDIHRTYGSTEVLFSLPSKVANPFITEATEATVAAYTGITINHSTKTCTVSSTKTIPELYDYSQYDLTLDANMGYPEWFTTLDGVNFTIDAAWNIVVTGSLSSTDKTVSGTLTVSSGGFFRDSTLAKWDVSSTTYYASPITLTFKDGATAKQYVECAIYDDTATNRTYNTSLALVTSLTSDGSGVVTGYAVYRIGATTYTGHALKARLYGYQTYNVPKTISGTAISTTEQLTADSFVSDSRATVAAFTGIALDYIAKTITTSTTHSILHWYEFIRYSDALQANLNKADTVTTADGVSLILITTWANVVTGSLTDVAKTISYTSGSLTVSGTGFFEDKTGAVWALSGSVYSAKHVYRNVKDILTSTNQQYAVVSAFHSDGTELCYNTSLTLGGLTTDASGNVEAYYVWKKDATTYTINEYCGLYAFQWAVTPISSNGLAIGSSGSYETLRLVTDSQVTLSRVAALAISGITVTDASDMVDLNANTLSETNDNLKARQARTNDIETGVKGYLNYYSNGLLLSKSGTTYTGKAGWTYHNSGNVGVFQTGIIQYDTPGVIAHDFGVCTIDFATAGTYDLRTSTFSGTVTLTNSSGGAVTVQLGLSVVYVNSGPSITIDTSISTTIEAPNIISGSRIQIYNVTQDYELDNSIVTAPYSLPVTIPSAHIASGDTIRMRATYASGTTAKKETVAIGVMSTSTLSFIDGQEDWDDYSTIGIDGSTVTEFAPDYPHIQVDIDDPDGVTTKQRFIAWWIYNLTTAEGIRSYFEGVVVEDIANYRVVTSVIDLKMDNVSSDPLLFSDSARIYRDDGDTIIGALSNSIQLDGGKVYLPTGVGTDGALTVGQFIALK